ncbi:MAG: LamG domain-containing protein, partial [Kiritimatiellae bacterium]|nr:LamG domain-containing protein [Kiritimatiellia bacterium]
CGYANMGDTYVLLKCIGGTAKQMGVLFGYVPMTLQLYVPNAANPEKGKVASEIRNTHSLVQLPDDGWHHFAYTYDGMVFGAYLDGAPVRELHYNFTQCGDLPSLQVGTLRVGRAPGGGNLFKGGLDELRLETTGRSAEWIKACYDDQRGAFTEVRIRPIGAVISIR